MQIKLNKYCIEYLTRNNIYNQKAYNKTASQIFKETELIHIPDEGFVEEFSCLNGNIFCQMGAISYSNGVIPRIDIKIGRYCSFARGWGFIAGKHPLQLISTSSFAYDANFAIYAKSNAKFSNLAFKAHPYHTFLPSPKPTIIEDDVYVCTDALLKPGVTLHRGCVVAQRAVVTRDVPEYAIVGGIPARVVGYRFDEVTRKRLLELKWWEYHFSSFNGIDLHLDINSYLDELEKNIKSGNIKPFNPAKVYFKELKEMSEFKGNTLVLDKPKPSTAALRIKNTLSYKLGQAMIRHSKSSKNYIKLLFILNSINKEHKAKLKAYEASIKTNPSLKLPPLETYKDYDEALKIKEHLSYRLGFAFIQACKTWYKGTLIHFIFEARRLVKEFKAK